jgi:hypothetical protein
MIRRLLRRIFGRRPRPATIEWRMGTPSAAAPSARPDATAPQVAVPQPAPPPPPPPPPSPLEPAAPGGIRLVLEDGTVQEVPADPEMAERARYLAENLIRRDRPPS